MSTRTEKTLAEAVRDRARSPLASGAVNAVIAWRQGPLPGRAQPALFQRPEELAHLLVSGGTEVNLAVFLNRPEVRRRFPVALVARPADVRSVVVLIQEGQLKAEDVRPMAIDFESGELLPGDSVTDLLPWLKTHYPARDLTEKSLEPTAEIEGLPLPERWQYWKDQFSQCIRCYACREACPLCYCERCIVELNQPQWLEPSAHGRGNLNWNLIRAFHLAGRCTLCGACEDTCPVDIPLMTLNRMLARHVWEEFGHAAGLDPDAPPLLSTWRPEDSNELFR